LVGTGALTRQPELLKSGVSTREWSGGVSTYMVDVIQYLVKTPYETPVKVVTQKHTGLIVGLIVCFCSLDRWFRFRNEQSSSGMGAG
jgi:uncharacterized protein YacL